MKWSPAARRSARPVASPCVRWVWMRAPSSAMPPKDAGATPANSWNVICPCRVCWPASATIPANRAACAAIWGRRQPARAGDLLHEASGRADPFPCPCRANKKRIAVIGAGLAGLVCAWDLAGKGYPVTVFHEGDPKAQLLSCWPVLAGAGPRPGCRMGGPGPPGRAL